MTSYLIKTTVITIHVPTAVQQEIDTHMQKQADHEP